MMAEIERLFPDPMDCPEHGYLADERGDYCPSCIEEMKEPGGPFNEDEIADWIAIWNREQWRVT